MAGPLRVVTIAAGLVMAAPAFAGTCSDKTGGDSNTLIWTGSTYTCAYAANSGKKSIGVGATGGWNSTTANGYERKTESVYQSGELGIVKGYTSGQGKAPSTMTYSVTNTGSGTRHWAACVLWYASKGGSPAGDQYVSSCSGDYDNKLPANLMNISTITLAGPASVTVGQPANYTVTVAAPDGGGPATGLVVLYKSTVVGKEPVLKNCDGSTAIGSGKDIAIGKATLSNGSATVTTKFDAAGTSYVYAVYAGMPTTSSGMPSYCMKPPQRGLTPALQKDTLMVAAK